MLPVVTYETIERFYYNDSNSQKKEFISASKVIDSIKSPVKNTYYHSLYLNRNNFDASISKVTKSASEVVNQGYYVETNNKIQLVSSKIKVPSASKFVDDLVNK